MAFAAIGALIGGATATTALVLTAVTEIGMAMTVVGAVTGNKSLMKIGGVLGLVGGVGGMMAGAAAGGASTVAGGAADALGDLFSGAVRQRARSRFRWGWPRALGRERGGVEPGRQDRGGHAVGFGKYLIQVRSRNAQRGRDPVRIEVRIV